MARIRNIKPEFFDDETLAAVSLGARLAFIGLWTQADCEGRLEDRPARLKARLFPYDDDIDAKTVDSWLDDLHRNGFIQRYAVADRALIWIPKFTTHQYLSKREPASELPGIEEAQTSPRPVSDQSQPGRSTADKVSIVPCPMSSVPCPEGDGFDAFWESYPRKVNKEAARKAWKKLHPSATLQEIIMAALALHRASRGWMKDGGQFVPHAATWLNGHRWEDEVDADPAHQRKVGPSYSDDWFADCKQRHNGECETGPMHRRRCAIEADKAVA